MDWFYVYYHDIESFGKEDTPVLAAHGLSAEELSSDFLLTWSILTGLLFLACDSWHHCIQTVIMLYRPMGQLLLNTLHLQYSQDIFLHSYVKNMVNLNPQRKC